MPKNGRKRFFKKVVRYADKGARALVIAKNLANLINVEYKYIDTGVVSVNPSTTGALQCLSAIAQGDTSESRTGNSILLKSLRIKYHVTEHASATSTVVRVIVFIDNQSNGSVPSFTNLFESSDVLAYRNKDSPTRVKVLYDKTHTLSSSGSLVEFDQMYKQFKNVHEYFNATSGNNTDIAKNGLWIAYISNQGTNTPTLEFNSRIRFIDN